MTTWKTGRRALAGLLISSARPIDEFIAAIRRDPPIRVPGTAVFMSGNAAGTPAALVHNLKHNHVLHERIVLLTARTHQTPRVEERERIQVEPLSATGSGVPRSRFGFMEEPNIPSALRQISDPRLQIDPQKVTYFLGRETLIPVKRVKHMALWREKLFVTMSKNAMTATNYFRLPPDRVVELGAQLEF